MTWGGLKRGDSAIVVYLVGESDERSREACVVSVGRTWITVVTGAGSPVRFDAETGYGEFGYSVHTRETWADATRREGALRIINQARWCEMPTDLLSAVANVIDTAFGTEGE